MRTWNLYHMIIAIVNNSFVDHVKLINIHHGQWNARWISSCPPNWTHYHIVHSQHFLTGWILCKIIPARRNWYPLAFQGRQSLPDGTTYLNGLKINFVLFKSWGSGWLDWFQYFCESLWKRCSPHLHILSTTAIAHCPWSIKSLHCGIPVNMQFMCSSGLSIYPQVSDTISLRRLTLIYLLSGREDDAEYFTPGNFSPFIPLPPLSHSVFFGVCYRALNIL